jgi:hypothetical protein
MAGLGNALARSLCAARSRDFGKVDLHKKSSSTVT